MAASALITIQSSAGRVLDQLQTVEVIRSLQQPCEASFSVGDIATWEALRSELAIGSVWSVYVAGSRRLVGRLMTRAPTGDSATGVLMQCSIVSALYDAQYCSVPRYRQIKRATLRQVIEHAYEELQPTFEFRADVARNFLTGSKTAAGFAADVDSVTVYDAQAEPGTPPAQYVSEHLARFGLIQWDSHDGGLIIGAPNEDPTPQFSLSDADAINIAASQDYRDATAKLTVTGAVTATARSQFTRVTTIAGAVRKNQTSLTDDVLTAAGVPRHVVIDDAESKTGAQAERRARREMSARLMATDTLQASVHGFTRDGLHWTENCCVAVQSREAAGLYIVLGVTQSESAANGPVTQLALLRQGIWRV